MASKDELVVLLERCKAATAADWGINCAIAACLGWTRLAPPKDYDRPMSSLWVSPEGETSALPPNWTGSLDAITALIERQGYLWAAHNEPSAMLRAAVWPKSILWQDGSYDADGLTAPLALCAAFLTALIAQSQAQS